MRMHGKTSEFRIDSSANFTPPAEVGDLPNADSETPDTLQTEFQEGVQEAAQEPSEVFKLDENPATDSEKATSKEPKAPKSLFSTLGITKNVEEEPPTPEASNDADGNQPPLPPETGGGDSGQSEEGPEESEDSAKAVPEIIERPIGPDKYALEAKGFPRLIVTDRITDPEASEFARSYLKERVSMFDRTHFEGETPPTDDEKRLIDRSAQALVKAGEDLGIDISDRVPPPSAYHFFDTQEYINKAYGPQAIEHNPVGFVSEDTGISFCREAMAGREEGTITHELVHAVQNFDVLMKNRQDNIDITLKSRLETEVSHGFDEFVTDLMAVRAFQQGADRPDTFDTPYVYNDVVGTAAIKEAALQWNMQPKELEDMLLRGTFDTGSRGIALLMSGLGPERWSVLQRLPIALTARNFPEYTRALGVSLTPDSEHPTTIPLPEPGQLELPETGRTKLKLF